MEVTLELLQAICPKTKKTVLEKYVYALNDVAQYYEMTQNPKRLAGYMANIVHESGYLTTVTENLNYSAKGLMTTFKKYFPTEELAKQYERQPEKIANRVYANRMANGPESSGDGWKFRGRGLIQLTGRHNYTKFAEGLGISLDETVVYMETPEGASSSSGWYWDCNNLNAICDKEDWERLTKMINGGLIGHAHRMELINQVLKLFEK